MTDVCRSVCERARTHVNGSSQNGYSSKVEHGVTTSVKMTDKELASRLASA